MGKAHKSTKPSLVLVGAPPPPFHGQAVMAGVVWGIDFSDFDVTRLEAKFDGARGVVSLSKLKVAAKVCYQLARTRLLSRNPLLYYVAGSASYTALIRDAVILGIFGRLYKNRVVHFHAGGLPEAFRQSICMRLLGFVAYSGVSVSVGLTEFVDVPCFGKTKKILLRNGLSVPRVARDRDDRLDRKTFRILFVCVLRVSKGIRVLLQAAQSLLEEGERDFSVQVVGPWASDEERAAALKDLDHELIDQVVEFTGELAGDEKWAAFHQADAFVFPSFFESENQPLVLIEAMGSSLPIVSTRWRGIPEMVPETVGVLVDPGKPDSLMNAIRALKNDPERRREMARAARDNYEKEFSLEAFEARLRAIFKMVLEN